VWKEENVTALPVEKTVIYGPVAMPVYEVTGNLDGQPIFLGLLVQNAFRGGFDASTKEVPEGRDDWTWKPDEERAIRWMQELKGL
jgi:hypothetical protein